MSNSPTPLASVPAIAATTRAGDEIHVLRPFLRQEAISTREFADLAGISLVTARLWATRYGLGRRVGGPLRFSMPAALMHLENDRMALRLYHQGNRLDPRVASYFKRCGIDPVAAFGAGDMASAEGGAV